MDYDETMHAIVAFWHCEQKGAQTFMRACFQNSRRRCQSISRPFLVVNVLIDVFLEGLMQPSSNQLDFLMCPTYAACISHFLFLSAWVLGTQRGA